MTVWLICQVEKNPTQFNSPPPSFIQEAFCASAWQWSGRPGRGYCIRNHFCQITWRNI